MISHSSQICSEFPSNSTPYVRKIYAMFKEGIIFHLIANILFALLPNLSYEKGEK